MLKKQIQNDRIEKNLKVIKEIPAASSGVF